jgi:P27 family predicted phage terminase small subunit
MAAGPRGPRPLPTHLKVLRGNPGHQALNKFEPQPMQAATVPDAPEFLTGYAADEWRRVVAELYRLKLLTVVDVNPLAAYCQAYKRWRTAEQTIAAMAERDPITHGLMIRTRKGHAAQNPMVLTAQAAARDMVRYAAEFGFTPAARSRITAADAGANPVGKFDGLLAG